MAQTQLNGPLVLGDQQPGDPNGSNLGSVVLSQTLVLTQNGTNAVSGTFTIPKNSQLEDFLIDVQTAFDSVTSATLTIGVAAAGTDYAGAVSAKTAGRAVPAYTGAQLAAMANVGANTTVTVTITPVGATTVGQVQVTARYVQNFGK